MMGLQAIRHILTVTVIFIVLLDLVLSARREERSPPLRSLRAERRPASDNFIFSASLLFSYDANTLTDCARACVQNTDCTGFTYRRLSSPARWTSCRGHSKRVRRSSISAPGYKAYLLETRKGWSFFFFFYLLETRESWCFLFLFFFFTC